MMYWGHPFGWGVGLVMVMCMVIFWGGLIALAVWESEDSQDITSDRIQTLWISSKSAMPRAKSLKSSMKR